MVFKNNIELTITPNYVSDWDFRDAVRELIQNGIDQETLEKDMLYSAITAMVNIIYLNACFNTINVKDTTITEV